MAGGHSTLTHYDNKVDNIVWEHNVWLSFTLNRILSGRKGHITLHFLCQMHLKWQRLNKRWNWSVTVVWSLQIKAGPVYSVDSMCLRSCVRVWRKGAPSDAQRQFGITQCSAKTIWQTRGGAGTSGSTWDKAGQDGTWEGRTVACEATGNSNVFSRNSAPPIDDTD